MGAISPRWRWVECTDNQGVSVAPATSSNPDFVGFLLGCRVVVLSPATGSDPKRRGLYLLVVGSGDTKQPGSQVSKSLDVRVSGLFVRVRSSASGDR